MHMEICNCPKLQKSRISADPNTFKMLLQQYHSWSSKNLALRVKKGGWGGMNRARCTLSTALAWKYWGRDRRSGPRVCCELCRPEWGLLLSAGLSGCPWNLPLCFWNWGALIESLVCSCLCLLWVSRLSVCFFVCWWTFVFRYFLFWNACVFKGYRNAVPTKLASLVHVCARRECKK